MLGCRPRVPVAKAMLSGPPGDSGWPQAGRWQLGAQCCPCEAGLSVSVLALGGNRTAGWTCPHLRLESASSAWNLVSQTGGLGVSSVQLSRLGPLLMWSRQQDGACGAGCAAASELEVCSWALHTTGWPPALLWSPSPPGHCPPCWGAGEVGVADRARSPSACLLPHHGGCLLAQAL